ncbi:hypothetical protein [Nocardioides ferulae]|uniref:hypothetical protein n=1 Tax=Nocardioides ferulae TaxID=2340821 RepID=UPI000EAEAB43|nr:hypothetical protein [Nocardioides ferulae]
MRRPLILLTVALTVTAGLVVCGLLLPGEEAGRQQPPAAATPLSGLDTDALVAARAAFCDAVPAAWVEDVLGSEPSQAQAWGNGDTLPAAAGVRDVAHEFGCRWAAGDLAVEGWVFAPPVTAARARELVGAARETTGCTPLPAAAALGSPSVALTCGAPHGQSTATYAGLLGDAWLTCRVTGPAARAELAETADRWCGMVLAAAGAG